MRESLFNPYVFSLEFDLLMIKVCTFIKKKEKKRKKKKKETKKRKEKKRKNTMIYLCILT